MKLPTPLEVAAALDVHHNFLPRGADTFCSLYLCAFLGMRGKPIPMVDANAQLSWFAGDEAKALGWRHVVAADAFDLANHNKDADVVAGVALQPHGHVGVVLEALPNTPGRICVSAAGGSNFVRAPIERSFGSYAPTFFANALEVCR